MRIERAAALLALVVLSGAGPARAQVRVDMATQVSSIRFDLEPGQVVPESDLRAATVLKARSSADALVRFFSWLPFVSPPEPRLFSPVELQRDLARIRRMYLDAGYPNPDASYDVVKDDRKNRVAITFKVVAGRPQVVKEVAIVAADSLPALVIREQDRQDWEHLQQSVRKLVGRPAERSELTRVQVETSAFFRKRGHPWSITTLEVTADSARSEARVVVKESPGPDATIGEVTIEGASSVTPATIRRELPFHTGDRYSEDALREGKKEIQQLDIVRLARVDLAPDQPRDSVVDVRVQVTESDRRLVSGDFGYVSDAGLTTEARWTHRNINARASTLTFTGVAQTGWLALVEDPDRRYRGAVALTRPYLLDRRMSLSMSPFVEYRNDQQDRSTQYGVDLTLLYQFAPLRSTALKYTISNRDVYQYRFGDFAAGDVDLLTFLQQRAQEALGSTLKQSSFTLTANTGTLDDPTQPHRGHLVRPALQVTVPDTWNSTEYRRVDLGMWGYLPLGRRSTLVARVAGGQLFPFGKSLPQPGDDPSVKFLQLKDATFTAGGSSDVRGWSNRMLGPKFPDARVHIAGTDTTLTADGYVPSGGLARVSGSLELQLPLPLLGSTFGWHTFLDAGRVWTPDERFAHSYDPGDQERWFYATGAGIDLKTPVGPIRFSVGYKLNPSIEDLADSNDLIQIIAAGGDPQTVAKHRSRRFAYQLAIGSGW